MAFAQEEPFGGPVEDMRAGLDPAIAVNMNRKEGADPISWQDFYPWHQPPKPEEKQQTPEEIAENMRALLNRKANTDAN